MRCVLRPMAWTSFVLDKDSSLWKTHHQQFFRLCFTCYSSLQFMLTRDSQRYAHTDQDAAHPMLERDCLLSTGACHTFPSFSSRLTVRIEFVTSHFFFQLVTLADSLWRSSPNQIFGAFSRGHDPIAHALRARCLAMLQNLSTRCFRFDCGSSGQRPDSGLEHCGDATLVVPLANSKSGTWVQNLHVLM